MKRTYDSVFISYRRSASRHLARLIFNNLRSNGYDAFLDVVSIKSGKFGQVILKEIPSRAHFVFIVSRDSLARCSKPNDWLRSEFETALATKRNIVPVLDEDISSEELEPYLAGPLKELLNFNCLTIRYDYFDAGLEKLRDWLAQPVDVTLEKTDAAQKAEASERLEAAVEAGTPSESELSAEKLFNDALRVGKKKRMRLLNQAIEINPDYRDALAERARLHRDRRKLDAAVADFDKAIACDSEGDPSLHIERGKILRELDKGDAAKEDFLDAVSLYTGAIDKDPEDMQLFLGRAAAYKYAMDYASARADYSHVIDFPREKLRPSWPNQPKEEYTQLPVAEALWKRGQIHLLENNYTESMNDCNRIIDQIGEDTDMTRLYRSLGYGLRAMVHGSRGHKLRAIRDIQKSQLPGEWDDSESPFWGYATLLSFPLLKKVLGPDTADPFDEIIDSYKEEARMN